MQLLEELSARGAKRNIVWSHFSAKMKVQSIPTNMVFKCIIMLSSLSMLYAQNTPCSICGVGYAVSIPSAQFQNYDGQFYNCGATEQSGLQGMYTLETCAAIGKYFAPCGCAIIATTPTAPGPTTVVQPTLMPSPTPAGSTAAAYPTFWLFWVFYPFVFLFN